MRKHVNKIRLQSIKCIVDSCSKVAAPKHAICNYHLALEIILFTILSGASIWFFIYFTLNMTHK